MRSRDRLLAGLAVLALSLSAIPLVAAAAPGRVEAANLGATPVERVIVRWNQGPGAVPRGERLTRLGAALPGLSGATDIAEDAVAYTLPVRRSGAAALGLLRSLAAVRGVASVAPSVRLTAVFTPDDTYFDSNQQALHGTWGINAPAAWDTTTGSGVTVAVIDTGLTSHSEFAGRVLPGYDFISNPAVANDGDGGGDADRDDDPSDPGDWVSTEDASTFQFWGCPTSGSSWHGTHTAGTVGAAGDNTQGVAGVAWSANIVPVRVLGKCGGDLADVAAAIRWAAGGTVPGVLPNANPARVLSISLGGGASCDSTLQAAIDDANARGALVVVAAGNSNTNASSFTPANCDGVLVVAALDDSGKRASFSNYGSAVTLSAPGVSIASTSNAGATSPVVAPMPEDESYVLMNGTSMATPHVSGVAALALAVNPSLTPAQLRTLLVSTVRPFAADGSASGCAAKGCGAGLLDAAAAVAAAGSVPEPTPTPTPTPPVVPFTDTADSPFKPDIDWLYLALITTGCAPTLYCPDAPVLRGQMASFLVRALHLPSTANDYFSDDETSIHEDDINRLAAAGITSGCGQGNYCPAVIVSREQMAGFLHRAPR